MMVSGGVSDDVDMAGNELGGLVGATAGREASSGLLCRAGWPLAASASNERSSVEIRAGSVGDAPWSSALGMEQEARGLWLRLRLRSWL